ncbi:MAG TPA: hypothetical protein VFF13_05175 [archaeon]|nr:hypothetical protein [archaeon]
MTANQQVGGYAFIVGAIIAILAGVLAGLGQSGVLTGVEAYIPIVLVALGVVVGLLNIKDKNPGEFLIAAIALIALAGTAGGLQVIDEAVSPVGSLLVGIVQNLAVFVAPAALIVALKAVKNMAAQQVN